MGHGEAFDWATERLGERAKPKANLPQGTQGCAGEYLEPLTLTTGWRHSRKGCN